jgi:hypothetical protein
MAHGEIVFDGAPALLTRQTLNAIYGADDGAISESITSTSIEFTPVMRPAIASEGMLPGLAS